MTQNALRGVFLFPAASVICRKNKKARLRHAFLYLVFLFLCEHLCNFFVEVVFSLCDTFALFVTLKSNN